MSIIVLRGNNAQSKNIRYEFDTASEPIGEGGMGKVFRGRQISEITGVSTDVAIKFMFDGLPKSVIERARREAAIQVVSENLVEMKDFIETQTQETNGAITTHYHVVSELLTGVMLEDLLNGVTTTKEGVRVIFAENLYKMFQEDRAHFALIIMKNVASGIMTLHDRGFIHRDIDPTNIMVTADGKIKLIDFGIAKKLPSKISTTGDRLSTQDRSLTMTGQFVGKPQYAAPELVSGLIDSQNETTDIYAMGIMLYQLLVGKLPFTGSSTKVLEAQKNTKTPVKNIVNVAFQNNFRDIVAKATEKEQEKRYRSAAEFRVALDSIGREKKSYAWLYAVGAVVGLGIAAAVFFLLKHDEKDFDKDDEELSMTIQEELYNPDTAEEGWEHLLSMGDAEALYLQSRIYYDGEVSDSIAIMKGNLSSVVENDFQKAHELLNEAYELNPDDPKILYALGMDYYNGNGQDLDGDYKDDLRNLDAAKDFFSQAKRRAAAIDDAVMERKAEIMLAKCPE